MCFPAIIVETHSIRTKPNPPLRPLSRAFASPPPREFSGPPIYITRAPSSSIRYSVPIEYVGSTGHKRTHSGSTTGAVENSNSQGPAGMRPSLAPPSVTAPLPAPPSAAPALPAPAPAPPSQLPPPFPSPIQRVIKHQTSSTRALRSASPSSITSHGFRSLRRKVSVLWARVDRLDKDKERRKLERSWDRGGWERQVDQRLLEGRLAYRHGFSRHERGYYY